MVTSLTVPWGRFDNYCSILCLLLLVDLTTVSTFLSTWCLYTAPETARCICISFCFKKKKGSDKHHSLSQSYPFAVRVVAPVLVAVVKEVEVAAAQDVGGARDDGDEDGRAQEEDLDDAVAVAAALAHESVDVVD